jgi:hypothetical protein
MRVGPPLRSTPARPAPVDDRPSEYGWFGSDEAITASLSPSDCTASPLSTWPPVSTRCSHRNQSRSTSDAPVPTELGGPMSAPVEKCCRPARRNRQCVNGQVALLVVPGPLTLGDLAGWTGVVVVVEHGRVAPLAAGRPADVAGGLDGRSSQHGAARSQRRFQGGDAGTAGGGARRWFGSSATAGVGGGARAWRQKVLVIGALLGGTPSPPAWCC